MWPLGPVGTWVPILPALTWSLLAPLRVPTVPVKNLTGSSPVNPALAGEEGAAAGAGSPGTGGTNSPSGAGFGEHLGFGVSLVFLGAICYLLAQGSRGSS